MSTARYELGTPALPEGKWCGHILVDLQTWRCPDCNFPLPDGARARLEAADPIAPPGSVWALCEGLQDDTTDSFAASPGNLVGLFTDRRKIASILIRAGCVDAESIRKRRIHWYQCVFNHNVFEGWDEGQRSYDGRGMCYSLELETIDNPGE